MQQGLIIIGLLILVIFIFLIARRLNKDARAQRALDKYINKSFSTEEIGRFYERYIGYLYEVKGNEVVYHGAINGTADLGRDLIIKHGDEVLIVQTKCWSKYKMIPVKHIFQLYGSMIHFRLTSNNKNCITKAVFFTTARYSDTTRDAAKVLGIELRSEELNRYYPKIKCSISMSGEKIYYLPFDPYYDEVKVETHKGEFFAETVKEAVAKGFRRAG